MATTRRENGVQTPATRRVTSSSLGTDPVRRAQQPPEADFLTLIGPLHALERVIDQWGPLAGAANIRLTTPPRILALAPAAEDRADETALRVAVVRHAAALGPRLVSRLRNRFARLGFVDVYAEEGYFLSPSSPLHNAGLQPATNGFWSVDWEPTHLAALRRISQVTLDSGILGANFVPYWKSPYNISLIDTGDEGADRQTGFVSELTDYERPSDHHGHGTAVGSLIRMIAPQVGLHSYRVMRPGENFSESAALLNAVASAMLTYEEFHIVVIPQRANLSVTALGQRDAIHRIVWQNSQRAQPTPVVVCAAGNAGSRESMNYPATVPGVMVAVALDWFGRRADYNCSPPRKLSVFTVPAFGGTKKDPLGSISRTGFPTQSLYGSSFAAALVAGALASRGSQ